MSRNYTDFNRFTFWLTIFNDIWNFDVTSRLFLWRKTFITSHNSLLLARRDRCLLVIFALYCVGVRGSDHLVLQMNLVTRYIFLPMTFNSIFFHKLAEIGNNGNIGTADFTKTLELTCLVYKHQSAQSKKILKLIVVITSGLKEVEYTPKRTSQEGPRKILDRKDDPHLKKDQTVKTKGGTGEKDDPCPSSSVGIRNGDLVRYFPVMGSCFVLN